MEEIRMLRESLKPPAGEPSTPVGRKPKGLTATLTPKSQSHLKSLGSYMHEGQVKNHPPKLKSDSIGRVIEAAARHQK